MAKRLGIPCITCMLLESHNIFMTECPGEQSILPRCCTRCPHYIENINFRAKMLEEDESEIIEEEEELDA